VGRCPFFSPSIYYSTRSRISLRTYRRTPRKHGPLSKILSKLSTVLLLSDKKGATRRGHVASNVSPVGRVRGQNYFPLIVNRSVSRAVQLGNHKVQEVAASRVGHFRCAEVFSLSLPQTFFRQATGSERIVANVCSGRRDVLANPFLQVFKKSGGSDMPTLLSTQPCLRPFGV
jgi:hypothetical protein